jgi:hypothetical protein
MNTFGNRAYLLICNTLPLHHFITTQKLSVAASLSLQFGIKSLNYISTTTTSLQRINYLSSSAIPHESLAVEEDGYRSHPHATVAITGLSFQQQQQQRHELGDELSRQVKKTDNVVA